MSAKLGVDIGEARIGIAKTDALGLLPHPVETIKVNQEIGYLYDQNVYDRIFEICQENEISEIVIGLPIGDDGKIYDNSRKIQQFAKQLGDEFFERSGIFLKVHFQDERFSTLLAHKQMRENGLEPSKNRNIVDQVAAVNILEQFLSQTVSFVMRNREASE